MQHTSLFTPQQLCTNHWWCPTDIQRSSVERSKVEIICDILCILMLLQSLFYYIQHVQVAYLFLIIIIIILFKYIIYIDCYIYLTLLSQIAADRYQGDFLSAVLSSHPLLMNDNMVDVQAYLKSILFHIHEIECLLLHLSPLSVASTICQSNYSQIVSDRGPLK